MEALEFLLIDLVLDGLGFTNRISMGADFIGRFYRAPRNVPGLLGPFVFR